MNVPKSGKRSMKECHENLASYSEFDTQGGLEGGLVVEPDRQSPKF